MNKQIITLRQAMCTLAVFIIGSSIIVGVSTAAEQDSWISFLFSMVIVIPAVLVYARIIKLYPEEDIYGIIEIIFGRIAGKIITVLITWYAIHLAALVLRNFSEFIAITSLPETPQLIVMIIFLSVTVYLVRSGMQTVGKWSLVAYAVIVTIMFITIVLLYNQMDFKNLFPIMNHSAKTILSGSYQLFTFPFAETVLFLAVADCIKKEDSPYKAYIYGVILGATALLSVVFRNLLALGPVLCEAEQFPSYTAARVINIGDFLVRIEGSISMNFILSGITKITICLFAASKGLASLFHIQDYKKLVVPVSLTVMALASIVYGSDMEMVNFIKIYQFYAIPFQIIIPILIWVGGEIKTRSTKKAQGNGG